MDMDILELCKENVQPLKRGRKVSQLGLALQAEVDTDLHEKLAKERGDFELAIITYDGPDPLKPRLDYIEWMEQTHLKHGKDCDLTPLLEDTITLLKDSDAYKQDPRFVKLFVKYIEAQDNAVELFQMVYSQGLGTMCAILYKAWADVLELGQDFKRANEVYQLGIANRAEPLDILKDAQAQFQLSVGRRMMQSASDLAAAPLPEENQPPQRQVLGKLKKDVGSVRKAHGAAGILTTKASKSSSKKLSVYQDPENDYEHLISSAMQKHKIGNIAHSEKNKVENTQKAGTWNKSYNRSSGLPPVPSTPSFSVHVDPDVETEAPKMPAKTPSNVLKTRKAELLPPSTAMDILGSAHSARKAIQSNFELYSGGRQFSFEELRAAYYMRKSLRCVSFQTPIKNSQQPSSSTFETPINNYSDLSPTEEESTRRKETSMPDQGEAIGGGGSFSSLETPLKRGMLGMPLTPSVGLSLSELLEETPQSSAPRGGAGEAFTIFSDDSGTPRTSTHPATSFSAKTDPLLPTIVETSEMGLEEPSSPLIRTKPTFGLRKKQLFSNEDEKVVEDS